MAHVVRWGGHHGMMTHRSSNRKNKRKLDNLSRGPDRLVRRGGCSREKTPVDH
jgi:hypothetical protein